jgi:site-specific DNA recombinase
VRVSHHSSCIPPKGLLLDELNAKGLRTRPTPKHPGKPLLLSNLGALLHKRYYIGKVTYRGVEYDGTHEPLVDPETFRRVQDVLRAHNLAGERQRVHHHYLKGTVYCARCHSRMILTNAKGQYLYFFCAGRQRRNGCTQPYVLTETVEKRVASQYAAIQLEPDRDETIRTELQMTFEHSRQHANRERARQTRRLKTLHDQQRKLMHAHYADAIPLDLFKDEQDRLRREIDQIQGALENSSTDWV